MSFKGINVRQSTGGVLIRASLKSTAGSRIVSGTATLMLLEWQLDGSLKTFDFADNTFKSTSVTTLTANLTYQKANSGAQDTGVWSYVQSVVSGFTRGNVYLAVVSHSSASPVDQEREFQYGDGEGDFTLDSSGRTTPIPAESMVFHSGQAQNGSSNTITLVSTASSSDNSYVGDVIKVYSNTGATQTRTITGYVGSSKIATVDRPWIVIPDSSSLYAVMAQIGLNLNVDLTTIVGTNNDKTGYTLGAPDSSILHSGTAQAGANGSITLASGASSIDNFYKDCYVKVYSGTGSPQVRIVTAYNGTTKIATIDRNWSTNPANGSLYSIPYADVPLLGSDGRVLVSADVHSAGVTIAAVLNGIAINVTGTVQADGGNSPTAFKLSTTGATNFLNGQWIRFKSGALINQMSRVSAFDTSTQIVTVEDAFTGTPSSSAGGDAYEVIPGMALTGTQVLNALTTTGTKIFVDTGNNGVILSTSDVTALAVAEISGLAGKHSGQRDAIYSGNNLTSFYIYLYDTAGNAATNDGLTGVQHKYGVINTFDSNGNLLTSSVTRIS